MRDNPGECRAYFPRQNRRPDLCGDVQDASEVVLQIVNEFLNSVVKLGDFRKHLFVVGRSLSASATAASASRLSVVSRLALDNVQLVEVRQQILHSIICILDGFFCSASVLLCVFKSLGGCIHRHGPRIFPAQQCDKLVCVVDRRNKPANHLLQNWNQRLNQRGHGRPDAVLERLQGSGRPVHCCGESVVDGLTVVVVVFNAFLEPFGNLLNDRPEHAVLRHAPKLVCEPSKRRKYALQTAFHSVKFTLNSLKPL